MKNRWNNFLNRLKQPRKIAAINPTNFEEIWSFNATGVQLISVIVLVFLIVGIVFTLLVVKGPFSSYFTQNDVSIERKKLENQHKNILELNKRIDEQENYISSIKLILSGETIKDSLDENIPEVQQISSADIQTDLTENQQELSKEVKDDLRTNSKKKRNAAMQYFVRPVSGEVSQKYDLVNHPAIDIVTSRDENVLACLSGTVIFSGYSAKDGFIIILDHANGYLSVYKHCKAVLKKTGAKVQMSDPIAIVGNTGENSTGPHLHFELWYNQSVVNPEDYMNFSKK